MKTKQLENYPNYIVNENGEIINKRGRVLKPQKNKVTGYYTVHISHQGKAKSYYVHRLVALAFIANPNNLSDTDHIDHDKSNNAVSNLRWCTRSTNMLNLPPRSTGTSQFKGVSWSASNKKWLAQISVDGLNRSLGLYADETKAATIYDFHARKYGFTYFNFN